jgi:hypothetical protein
MVPALGARPQASIGLASIFSAFSRQKRHGGVARLLMAGLLFLTAVLALPPGAGAEDMPAFVRLFLQQLEKQLEAKVAWGRARATADGGFVLEEVSWAGVFADKAIRPVGTSAEMRFAGLREEGDLLHAEKIEIRQTRIHYREKGADRPLEIRIPAITLSGNSMLRPGAARNEIEKLYEGYLVSSEMRAPEILFISPFSVRIENMAYTFTGDRRTLAGRGTLDIPRIVLPPEAAEMMKREDAFGKLGYSQFVLGLGVEWNSRWDEKERLHLDATLHFGMDKAGRLGLEVGELVVPLGLVRVITDAEESKRLERLMDGQQDDALMAMLQNELTLQRLRLFWEDEGLTARLLNAEARRKGLEVRDVAEAWAAAPQAFLFMLGLPAVGNQAGEALKVFLEDPRRLEVRMESKAPMNFLTLMTLLEDPQGLVDTLNLKIIANEGGERNSAQ